MKTTTINNYMISIKVLSQTYSGWVKRRILVSYDLFIHHCEYTNLKVTTPTNRKVPCLGKGVLSFFRNFLKSQWNSNVHIVHIEIR